jgi:hypothetical protein
VKKCKVGNYSEQGITSGRNAEHLWEKSGASTARDRQWREEEQVDFINSVGANRNYPY